MSDWPLLDGSSIASVGAVPAGSGTTLTSPTGLNTMGAWTQFVAATPTEAIGMMVNLSVYTGTGVPETALVDIGIGAAGSEKILVPQLYVVQSASPFWGFAQYFIPIAVPAGSALSARYQVAGVLTSNAYASAQLISGGLGSPPPLSRVTAYGAVPASSSVSSIPGNATAYLKGAWTQMVASTANPIQNLAIAARIGTSGGLLDIGVGAAGVERIIVPDCSLSPPDVVSTATWTLPVSVPAGTRLSARFLSGVAADTCKVGLWGVD